MRRFAVLAVLILVSAAGAAAQTTHPFNVRDLVMMDRISEPEVSPDGKWVAFTLRKTDLEANRGRTDVWIIGVDGKGLRQLTSHAAGDSGARWSPDGKTIYFLSSRSGSSQVWKVPAAGGDAVQVTDLPLSVSALVLSRDGSKMAFSADVYPDASMEETAKRMKEQEAKKSSGRVYDSLFIRHWDTWFEGLRAHVFVAGIDGKNVVDVTKGRDADAPSKPFGGAEEITFTPDGKSVIYTMRQGGTQEAWSTNFDLYVVPVDGSAAARNLTADNKAWDTAPTFSPDGKTLAYLAMARPGYESDRYRIVTMSWPDGKKTTLTESWDFSASSIGWSTDGRLIYTDAYNVGNHSLFAIDAKTGAARTIVRSGNVAGFDAAGDGVVYGLAHLRMPVELFAIRNDGTGERQLTSVNAERLASVRMGEGEQFSFKGANGDTVYAWIVKPVDFDPAKKYPVAFLIHGGPQGSFGNNFHYRWNPQTYAGAGYASVMVDFHGSSGYGQAFQDAINGDWGGKPLEDLQKGLAAALATYPWMDGDRVAALGASYGGFMVNWIAGQWPDRFRALVSHDGNLDERFAYFATEELWFPEWEHGGTPWENPEGYTKHNPIDHVAKWKTPMLVIHGGLDFRVVETQGMATFTALQRRGIPSRFLHFPDENHWVLKPANSILWHDTVIEWIDRWTKK